LGLNQSEITTVPDVKQKIEGSMQMRALFVPASIDKEARTVDVVFATEREVIMYNWSIGRFKEILVCNDSAGDLTRLNNGAPLLNTHQSYDVREILGSVVPGSAKFVKNQGVATIRFSSRADVDGVWQDVQDGHLSGISVGYTPTTYEEIKTVENTIPTLRATKWEANEISLAPVQADRDSMVRSADKTPHEITIIRTNSNPNIMTDAEKAALAAERTRSSEILKSCRAANLPAEYAQELIDSEKTLDQARAAIAEKATQPVPVNETEVRNAATTAERARVKDITTAVRAAKLDEAFATELIDGGISIDQARAKIIDKMAETETALPGANAGSIKAGADETDKRRAAATDGLLLRASSLPDMKVISAERVSAAREFRGLSLLDLAKESLTRAGVDYRGLDKMDIVGRAITSSSSDFAVILGGVVHQTLLNNYQAVADTWKQFCMIGSVSDFREHKRLRMGSFSRLDTVKENAEFKTKAISDASYESIIAQTFGNIINVSRKMIVNDDLQAFSRLAQMLGRAAARSIEVDVYALLAANPTLEDGVALFHSTHANLIASGAAPSVTTFDALRVAMAKQMDPGSNDYLDIRPSTLVIGIVQGGAAKVINGSQYDPDATNKLQKPNAVYGLFGNIVDTARITGNEFYAFANPAEEPVIEVAFLDGNQTPYLETKQGFEVDGMEWKIRHDYGVGAIGYRGVVKNPGA
jgi:hypothetical protein